MAWSGFWPSSTSPPPTPCLPPPIPPHSTMPPPSLFLLLSLLLLLPPSSLPQPPPPTPPKSLISQGAEAHSLNDLTTAQRIYRQILQSDPSNPDALHLLGLTLHSQSKSSEALPLISQALSHAQSSQPSSYSFHTSIMCNLGEVQRAIGLFSSSASTLQSALSLTPSSVACHYNLGQTYKDLGQSAAAISSLESVLTLDGSHQAAAEEVTPPPPPPTPLAGSPPLAAWKAVLRRRQLRGGRPLLFARGLPPPPLRRRPARPGRDAPAVGLPGPSAGAVRAGEARRG